ncbi:MAG: hypothetical protein EOO27_03165 [Comamonadaceae bacterium]|nr:MAG: hypothetical protein EOO27_03165 [Comamonadaceae bacterium]
MSLTALPAAALAGLPTMPSVTVPSAVPQQPPEQPKIEAIPEKLNAGAGRGAIGVTINERTWHGVRNERIAHIVSGGIGVG